MSLGSITLYSRDQFGRAQRTVSIHVVTQHVHYTTVGLCRYKKTYGSLGRRRALVQVDSGALSLETALGRDDNVPLINSWSP
ncbi:MAG: hypothetical protein VYA30_11675, partial [Myxococcota bacterium]|nr:hypothetical protein [Myxococcota bacterium]